MNNSKFYDPKEVYLNLNGYTVTGFADGDKIKIEPVTKEDWKSIVGVDGDTADSKVNDNRHTITFTLLAGSPSNFIIEAMRKLSSSIVVGVLNKSEGRYAGGGSGRISEKPSHTFGAESGKKEWKLLVPNWIGAIMPE
jgi:hypothetical protein